MARVVVVQLACIPRLEALSAVRALEVVGDTWLPLLRFPSDVDVDLVREVDRSQSRDVDDRVIADASAALLLTLEGRFGPHHGRPIVRTSRVRLTLGRHRDRLHHGLECLLGRLVLPQENLMSLPLRHLPRRQRLQHAPPDLVDALQHQRGRQVAAEEDTAPRPLEPDRGQLRSRAFRAAAGTRTQAEPERRVGHARCGEGVQKLLRHQQSGLAESH
mmetsp:Transcript_28929/g.96313  ORF Transcript_28929/g.96313 Transcript_28929/m.96313 type:complete len:217 (+) Transcript_28929:1708-2358(+)